MANGKRIIASRNGKPPSVSVLSQINIERGQDHATRRHLYERLQTAIRRPIISFFTSFAYPVSIEDADADIIEGLLRQIDTTRGLALMISSPGGSGEAAERIVNLCRSYSGTGEYWTIVPSKAKSAATVICFGASRLLMGPSSELGPVDPQIIFRDNNQIRFHSAYNLVKSYDDLFEKATQTQGRIEPYIQQLEHYDAREIQKYRELIDLADDIAVKTLKSGMMSKLSESGIKKKIERFLKPERTKSHGRPIFRDEASECGLRIANAERIWGDVY